MITDKDSNFQFQDYYIFWGKCNIYHMLTIENARYYPGTSS